MMTKIGVLFPQLESGTDPAAIRDYIQAVEGMGYDYLAIFDHVLGVDAKRPGWTGAYSSESLFHEPLVLFGFFAGLTQRLEFTTSVLIMPQRQTALLAKQAAEVDVLSGGGRLRLGVGTGWNRWEYEALGYDFTKRGRRADEQIMLLRRLWSEEAFVFEGRFDKFTNVGINPLPVHRSIPIWIGGTADAVLERVGRLGDGWYPQLRQPSELPANIEKINVAAVAADRDPSKIGYDAGVNIGDGVPTAVERGREWVSFGATHVRVNTMRAGYTSMQQHIDGLRAFKAAWG